VQIDRNDTAVVFIDPQNEVLSERGAAWAAVGESVKENRTVETIERIFQAAKQHRFEVFISPHYLTPRDIGAREQDVRAPRSIESRRLPRIGSGLARAVQALHRGREDRRRQPWRCLPMPVVGSCKGPQSPISHTVAFEVDLSGPGRKLSLNVRPSKRGTS